MNRKAILSLALPLSLVAVSISQTSIHGDDDWQMKVEMKDGSVKTFTVADVGGIGLGDTIAHANPGDVDSVGNPVVIKTTYRPYYDFIWYHDNLLSGSYPRVEIVNEMSDGTRDTVIAADLGHPACLTVAMGIGIRRDYNNVTLGGGEGFEGSEIKLEKRLLTPRDITQWVDCRPWSDLFDVRNGKVPAAGIRTIMSAGDVEITETDEGQTFLTTHSIGVDFIGNIKLEGYGNQPRFGMWDHYTLSRPMRDNEGNIAPREGDLNLIPGFYYENHAEGPSHTVFMEIGWGLQKLGLFVFDYYFDVYDQFLYINNKLIDFLHLKPKTESRYWQERITSPTRGECVVVKGEFNAEFAGKTWHSLAVDTIYEIKYPAPVLRYLSTFHYVEDDRYGIGQNEISIGSERELYIISSMPPLIRVTGEGVSYEIIDDGVSSYHTNKSLPFHKYRIILRAPLNISGEERTGSLDLLDSDGNVINTNPLKY